MIGRRPTQHQAPPSEWMDLAKCRGTSSEIFFSEHRNPSPKAVEAEALAKALCAECQVKPQCLHYALSIKERHGIWGGMTENERTRHVRRLRRERYQP